MIRDAHRDELPALRELLARANAAPYDLAGVAEEKCFGEGVAGTPHVRVWGELAGVAVTCGKTLRLLAVDPAQRRRGIGSALLEDAELLGARVAAAEAGNYFTPGVFDADAATLSFFAKHGYAETASTHNLEADLAGIDDSDSRARRATHAEHEAVLHYIEREFGRIWRFEAARAFDRPDAPTLMVIEHAGELAGFAAHDANNRGLGFFGPTGVTKSLRGRGLGRDLLLASLADLRRLGYRHAVIPWTDALEFYAKSCGARVAARFVTLAR